MKTTPIKQIKPGKAGTIPARELTTLAMGDGEGRPLDVIKGDYIYHYVGIGWVPVLYAWQSDADDYPVVVFGEANA